MILMVAFVSSSPPGRPFGVRGLDSALLGAACGHPWPDGYSQPASSRRLFQSAVKPALQKIMPVPRGLEGASRPWLVGLQLSFAISAQKVFAVGVSPQQHIFSQLVSPRLPIDRKDICQATGDRIHDPSVCAGLDSQNNENIIDHTPAG